MTTKEIQERFSRLRVWQRGSQRGLQSDGVWVVPGGDQLEVREGHSDPKKTELLKFKTSGGFTEQIFRHFRQNPRLVKAVAMDLLAGHFPETIHAEILRSVGLEFEEAAVTRSSRDSTFRPRVLTAYENRCAVCRTEIRLGVKSLGIEAAHIKWHQAGGPDTESNGLALCAMHHKLLDFGAIGLSPERRVRVSELATGSEGFENWVMRFNGVTLTDPVNLAYLPAAEYIDWHSSEVFQGKPRPI